MMGIWNLEHRTTQASNHMNKISKRDKDEGQGKHMEVRLGAQE